MDLIKQIINTKVTEFPWPYKVIDNFFEENIFQILTNFSKSSLSKFGVEKNQSIDPVTLVKLKSIIDPILFEEIFKVNSDLLKNTNNIANTFLHSRKYNSYYSMPSFHFLKPNAGFHPIHDEVIDKTISIVVYLYPEESVGTRLYKNCSNQSFECEVKWKPNRALIFCGNENITWHDFGTDHRPRVTLNFFLKKNLLKDFIETDEEFIFLDSENKEIRVSKDYENIEIKKLYDKKLITC